MTIYTFKMTPPIKPDLVLIYRKTDMETLQLVRLGSHSELSL